MENQNTQVSASLELVLTSALDNAKTSYPEMTAMAERAKIGLSGITQVTNDEEDERANKALVRTAATYDKIVEMRKAITAPLDSIKAQLMQPEKVVSLAAADKGSPAWVVKEMRNGYANEKAQRLQKEQKEIQANKDKNDELSRLKAHFENHFFESVLIKVKTLRTSVAEYFETIALEQWDNQIKRLSLTPKLKQDDFESWFIVDYDKTKLPASDFEKFLTTVKEQFTFDAVNKLYVEQAGPIVTEYKDKLPARKKELEEIAELEKTNAEAAKQKAAEQVKQREQELASKNAEVDATIKQNADEIQSKLESDMMDNEFEKQVNLQSQDALTGVRANRTAKITCQPNEIVKVMSAALFACYTNPNWKGHYKREKDGSIKKDDNGQPILADWAAVILDFWATNCSDAKIQGLEVVESFTAKTVKS